MRPLSSPYERGLRGAALRVMCALSLSGCLSGCLGTQDLALGELGRDAAAMQPEDRTPEGAALDAGILPSGPLDANQAPAEEVDAGMVEAGVGDARAILDATLSAADGDAAAADAAAEAGATDAGRDAGRDAGDAGDAARNPLCDREPWHCL